jgi:uncharacterized protein YjbI with pentapeptide repeats
MSQSIAAGATIESREQVRLLMQEGGLHGRKFVGFDIAGLRVDRARLDDSHFERISLVDSVFGDADLGRTRFDRTDLRRARFDSAVVVDASFEDCDLTEALLAGIHAERVLFQRGSLCNLVASGGRLVDVRFTETNLYGARLDSATLVRCRFDDPRPHTAAELTRVNLRGSVLLDCDLSGVNLYRADLGHTLFIRCNLQGATLTGAESSGARLVDCQTLGADLPDALRPTQAGSLP